jgi:hypothetical protein
MTRNIIPFSSARLLPAGNRDRNKVVTRRSLPPGAHWLAHISNRIMAFRSSHGIDPATPGVLSSAAKSAFTTIVYAILEGGLPDRTDKSIAALAASGGTHPRTFQKALKALELQGVIRRYRDPDRPQSPWVTVVVNPDDFYGEIVY